MRPTLARLPRAFMKRRPDTEPPIVAANRIWKSVGRADIAACGRRAELGRHDARLNAIADFTRVYESFTAISFAPG